MQAKPGKNILLAKAKPSKSERKESLRTSAKKLCALCGKKISLFLLLAVGLDIQCYVLFDLSLSEHIKKHGDGLYFRQSLGRTYRLRRQSFV